MTCKKQHTEPIDLDYCLKAFTSEEKLETKYHCSNCKDKQPATKKLQIWRLPPVLVSVFCRCDSPKENEQTDVFILNLFRRSFT